MGGVDLLQRIQEFFAQASLRLTSHPVSPLRFSFANGQEDVSANVLPVLYLLWKVIFYIRSVQRTRTSAVGSRCARRFGTCRRSCRLLRVSESCEAGRHGWAFAKSTLDLEFVRWRCQGRSMKLWLPKHVSVWSLSCIREKWIPTRMFLWRMLTVIWKSVEILSCVCIVTFLWKMCQHVNPRSTCPWNLAIYVIKRLMSTVSSQALANVEDWHTQITCFCIVFWRFWWGRCHPCSSRSFCAPSLLKILMRSDLLLERLALLV